MPRRGVAQKRHRPREASPSKDIAREASSLGHTEQKEGEEKCGFEAISLAPEGDILTREVPLPPLGDPGTDTTHERAITRGEPRAWYEGKVDPPPGQVTSDWDA